MHAPGTIATVPPTLGQAIILGGQTAAAVPIPTAADEGISPVQVAGLKQAAQDFEAMALGQMLAPMFNTVDTADGAFGGGAAEAAFKPMLVDAIARQIAAHGGLGLAAPVYATMLHAQESAAHGGMR